MRGTKLQMTKLLPSNDWWAGGGWCTRPVIGSKSEMLNVYGYRQPSQPDHVERVLGVDVPGADDAARAAVLDQHLDVGAVGVA